MISGKRRERVCIPGLASLMQVGRQNFNLARDPIIIKKSAKRSKGDSARKHTKRKRISTESLNVETREMPNGRGRVNKKGFGNKGANQSLMG